MKPTVSIIVPNYNHTSFLEERLDSIFKQTFQDFEVILLDDASTDGSLEILRNYQAHPKVSHLIVNEKNSGSPFKQWKKGLALAKGTFVWIAESDDSCEPNFLETQIHTLKAGDVAVALTKTFSSKGVRHEIAHPVFAHENHTQLSNDSLLFCPILNVSAIVFKCLPEQQLQNFRFTEYSIIGDRVFYYEAFQGKHIEKNDATTSFFRQEGTGVSNLDHKDISYLATYFEQHVRFITYVDAREQLSADKKRAYVQRFFARVRDRLSKKQKLSLQYVKIMLRYYSYIL